MAHIHTCTVSLWDWRHFCWWFLESRPDRCHELLQWEFSGGQSGWMGAWRGEQVAVKITSICNRKNMLEKKEACPKIWKLTYHSEVQTQKHPATTSLHTCCGLCSRWFQVPCSPAYHKTSTFSYPPQPSLDTWSQPARDRYEYICSHLCYILFNKTWR